MEFCRKLQVPFDLANEFLGVSAALDDAAFVCVHLNAIELPASAGESLVTFVVGVQVAEVEPVRDSPTSKMEFSAVISQGCVEWINTGFASFP